MCGVSKITTITIVLTVLFSLIILFCGDRVCGNCVSVFLYKIVYSSPGRKLSEYHILDGVYEESGLYKDTISEMKRFAYEKAGSFYNVDIPSDITELKVDGMSHFSCAVCVKRVDYDKMVTIISNRLKTSIPVDVYDSLTDSIFLKNVTYEGSFQNCTKPLQETGRASNFVGWWNVRFDSSEDLYSACIIVSGIDITMADIIVDYHVVKETTLLALEPCHCGFFYCEKCPVFKTLETRSPIFKKHRISLKQHNELKDYMMYKSLELIGGLSYEPNISLTSSAIDADV